MTLMTDNTIISVVVPAYNVGWCVRRALDSVLSQSYRQFELIVVNDGSTDDTGSVLDSYGNSIRVITQENAGMSNARNTGIRAASGAYIAFLDADDWWLPTKLEQQWRLMQNRPEIGFCSTSARVEDPQGNLLNIWKCCSKGNLLETLFIHKASIAGGCSAVMAKKTLLDKVGLFDEELKGFEDPDLWIRFAAASEYACIDEPLAVILRREKSVSTNLDAMRDSAVKSIIKNRDLLDRRLRGAFWRNALAGVYADYAKGYYRAGRKSAALMDILRIVYLAPLHRGRFCLGMLKDMLLRRTL